MNASIESELLAQVSQKHLWETNSAIAQWTRHSGTDEERMAFAYVQRTLDEYGFHTTLLDHPALVSYPIQSNLSVIDDDGNALTDYASLGAAFSASVDGLEEEVIDVGFGTAQDYARQGVAGKIVLINGLASPTAVYAAEQAGSIGQIFINDDHRHYMIVSSIWGTPTPKSAQRIPSTPSVSVTAKDGHDLRARLVAGPVRVRLMSQVFMDWQQTPILIADLPGQQSDDFVLFSGHLDSWEVGAMDNGSANATMIEVGRLLASRKAHLYRGLRLAFWSGHSHGRYSGSTWYVDNHWEELVDHCVAHVNVDSTGARGATFYGNIPAHLELGSFGAEIVREQTGQTPAVRSMSRAGDMSFNGLGIPALFMSMSQVPFREGEDTDYVSQAQGKLFGGRMPWWWHTSEDTLDKVDLDVLVLDTRVYVSTLWRFCHQPLLPMDFQPAVAEFLATLEALQTAAADTLDLSLPLDRTTRLAHAVFALAQTCGKVDDTTDDAIIGSLNRQIKSLSRLLIPLIYTQAGRFDHDPAWTIPTLPTLQDARTLPDLSPDSDEFHFLHTQLVRNRNYVAFVLREALELLDQSTR